MNEKSLALSMRFAKEYTIPVEKAVEITGFSANKIREWAHAGNIGAVKRFRRWYFSEKSILEFIKSKTQHNQ